MGLEGLVFKAPTGAGGRRTESRLRPGPIMPLTGGTGIFPTIPRHLVGVPGVLGMGLYRLSVRIFEQLECGNVCASQPKFNRPVDFTGCVTGMRR